MNLLKKPEIVIFILLCLFSLFFRIKIIQDLPAGTTTTKYGLQGFDDEPAHFKYTEYLIENQQLPVEKLTVSDSNAFRVNTFEFHQPPLYYLSIALFSEAFNISNPHFQLLTGRYFNLLLTLFSFYIIFLIFKRVGWKNEYIYTGLSFIVLLGSHVYQTSLFSNDTLSWLLFWWIFYLILKGSLQNWMLITLLLTTAHYTKTNILVIYPVLLWSLYINGRMKSEKIFFKSAGMLIIPFILASPWYIRNYILYDSFFLLSGSTWHFVSNYFESLIKLIHAPYSFLFRMYFLPPKFLISVFNIFQYLFVFPLIVTGIWQSKNHLKKKFNIQIMFLMLCTMIAAYLWLAVPTGFTEGRMLFPALPAIVYFLSVPLFNWQEKYNLPAYFKYALISILFVPPFIIGFYFY